MGGGILVRSPISVRASKRAVRRVETYSIADPLTEEWDYTAMKVMLAFEGFIEGLQAFAAKRPPEWKGR